jgi:hypothetical protein
VIDEVPASSCLLGVGEAGPVIAELGEDPGGEDDTEARLADVDLSVPVTANMVGHHLTQLGDLTVGMVRSRTWLAVIAANVASTWAGCRSAGARSTDWMCAAFSSTPWRLARRRAAVICLRQAGAPLGVRVRSRAARGPSGRSRVR